MTEANEKIKNPKIKDAYLCLRCGYCREMVRDFDSTNKICIIRDNTSGFEVDFARGKNQVIVGVLENLIQPTAELADDFFKCTTCGNCSWHCSIGLDNDQIFLAFREYLADLNLIPEKFIQLAENIKTTGNPYNEPQETRKKWAQLENPKIIYFMGCTSAYRRTDIAQATINVLNKLGVKFNVSKDEVCCGSVLIRTGQREQAIELAMKNDELLKGADIVLFSCAGCLLTFLYEYPSLLNKVPSYKLVHISEFLLNRLKEQNKLDQLDFHGIITYHDPCHLGRGQEFYEYPREIIKSIKGVEFKEMKHHHQDSLCCGAGGGVKSEFSNLALDIAKNRVQEAIDIGANYLVSTCPFCKTNLNDALNVMKETNEIKLEIIDLTELLDKIL